MEKVRCFIAVDPPAFIQAALARAIASLAQASADIRWTKPGNFHFTLKFLGSVPASQIAQVASAIERVAAQDQAFEARLGTAGAFPSFERPKIFWIGMEAGADRASNLASRLETNLEPLGFAREERLFHAHLTLGRARAAGGLRETAAVLKKWSLPAEPFRVEEIILYRSRLGPGGPDYDAIGRFRLRAGA